MDLRPKELTSFSDRVVELARAAGFAPHTGTKPSEIFARFYKLGDSTRDGEDAAVESGPEPSKVLASPPELMSPPQADQVPSLEAMSPSQADQTSSLEPMSPAQADQALPPEAISPPQAELVLPLEAITPSEANLAPPLEVISPHQEALAMSSVDAPPKHVT